MKTEPRNNGRKNLNRRHTLATFCLGGALFYGVSLLQNLLIGSDPGMVFNLLIFCPAVVFGGLFILGIEWMLQKIKPEIAGVIISVVLIPLLIAIVFSGENITNFARIFMLTFTWLGLYAICRKSVLTMLSGQQSLK